LQIGATTPSVKEQLAAIRMLFDWLVTGQLVPTNPAAVVRGPKHVVKTGKTPPVLRFAPPGSPPTSPNGGAPQHAREMAAHESTNHRHLE
jgi:hypothetical protein